MSNNIGYERSALAFGLALCLTGCNPSLESGNAEVRLQALQFTTNQAILAKVVLQDADAKVRTAAMVFVTNQEALARIALEGNDQIICAAAVEKLTNQALLAKVAISGTNSSNRKRYRVGYSPIELIESEPSVCTTKAAYKLSDQAILPEVVLQASDLEVCRIAAGKITDDVVLAKLTEDSKAAGVRDTCRSVLKARAACAPVTDFQRREAHIQHVCELLWALSDPLIAPRIGEVSVLTDWETRSVTYSDMRILRGEAFTCNVKTANLPATYSKSWESQFPEFKRSEEAKDDWLQAKKFDSSLSFVSPDMDMADLVAEIVQTLPQSAVSELLVVSRYHVVRRAAVKNLASEPLLKRIAIQDDDWRMKKAAKKRLAELKNWK